MIKIGKKHCYLFNGILFIFLFIFQTQVYSLPSSLEPRMRGKKLVAAHQGGLFDGAPNTIPLFEKARKSGADIIEMDLQISKDGIPMVFHDTELDTMTECQGKVSDYTAEELRKCQYTSLIFGKGSVISFEDVLKWNRNRVILNVEFKIHEVIPSAIKLVEKYDALGSVYFQTKGDKTRYIEARFVSTEVELLFAPGDEETLDWALSLNDEHLLVIELHENLRNPYIISKIQAAGKFASENSWHWRYDYEFFGTSCDYGFYHLNFDILVTNRPKDCLSERKKH